MTYVLVHFIQISSLPGAGLNPGTSVDGDLRLGYAVDAALLAAEDGSALLVLELRSC